MLKAHIETEFGLKTVIVPRAMALGPAVVQGNVPTTPNFDWTLVPSTTAGGYFLVKCNATGQYLNILDSATNNGAPACQGNTPTSDNFLWKII